MNFDKSRVYTALSANELKVGSKVIAADNLLELKENISNPRLLKIIEEIKPESWEHRFFCNDGFPYSFVYLVEEPEENKLKWTDLKLGDVITNGKCIVMITEIDKDSEDSLPVFAGHKWFDNNRLIGWVKVENEN